MREFEITVVPRQKEGSALRVGDRVITFNSTLKVTFEYLEDEGIIEREVRRIAESYQELNDEVTYEIELRTFVRLTETYELVYSFNTKYNRFIKYY
jgi:hypothetical protein